MTFLSIWNADSILLLAQHVSTGHSSWALLGGLAALITAVAGLIGVMKKSK
jgi:LPXTG-motif cell wall-anchored protein